MAQSFQMFGSQGLDKADWVKRAPEIAAHLGVEPLTPTPRNQCPTNKFLALMNGLNRVQKVETGV